MKVISIPFVPIRKYITLLLLYIVFSCQPISCSYKLSKLSSSVIPEYAVRKELMVEIHHLAVQVCWKCLPHPASATPKQQSDVLPSGEPIYPTIWDKLNFFLALITPA